MAKQIGPWCRHYPLNNMPLSHECDAPIVGLAEAPGKREEEDEWGRPLIGPAGYTWETWLRAAGLRREHCYIDNTYPFRPNSKNDLSLISPAEREKYAKACLFRLRRQQAVVYVPMGNYAMRLLFGDDKIHTKISDWRGSVLSWEGRKCVPTIHPAATFRQRVLEKLCRADWMRVADELKRGREFDLPKRHHIIGPTEGELEEFERNARVYFAGDGGNNSRVNSANDKQSPPRVMAVDVENSRKYKSRLYCVGFSFDPSTSITVSTMRGDYSSDGEFTTAQWYIRRWLSEPWPVVGLNYQTDLWKLYHHWPDLREALISNYVWDLMEMAHLLDPNDGGGTEEGSEDETDDSGVRVGMYDLATLQSLHTRQPFHKYMSAMKDWQTKATYNGLDCCVTREIFDRLWEKLDERGLV